MKKTLQAIIITLFVCASAFAQQVTADTVTAKWWNNSKAESKPASQASVRPVTRQAQPVAPEEQPAAEDGWILSRDQNAIDGKNESSAIVKAESGPESLVVRCNGSKMRLILLTEHVINAAEENFGFTPLRLRFDEGKIEKQVWQRSEDMTALFSRDTKKDVALLKTAKRFVVEYERFGEGKTTATFDVQNPPLTSCE